MKRGSGVLSARRTGVVSIQPKTPEQAQTICKFPENLLISEMRTVQPKVLEIPGKNLMTRNFLVRKFRIFEYTSRGSSLKSESFRNANRKFWSNEKRSWIIAFV